MSENPIVQKATSLCRSLSDIRIKEDHDMTLKIYSASAPDKPECEHIISGSSDHSLIKALTVIGAVSVLITAVCTTCALLRE